MTDLFSAAGEIIDAVIAKRGSARNLALNHPQVANKKKLFAIVTRTLESMILFAVFVGSYSCSRKVRTRKGYRTVGDFA